MREFFLVLLAVATCALGAQVTYEPAEPGVISARIAELVTMDEPVLLDIRAGDLTSELDLRLRQLLLEKGADIRELPGIEPEDWASAASDTTAGGSLNFLGLRQANILQVSLELGSATVESKSFLSYRSERFPLYNFQIRQIQLPGLRLRSIHNLSFIDQNRKEENSALRSIKWFEPVLASTVLASIIYLLWTTE